MALLSLFAFFFMVISCTKAVEQGSLEDFHTPTNATSSQYDSGSPSLIRVVLEWQKMEISGP